MASSTSERSTTGARASTTKERGSNVDASCMQAAVAVREASLASAWGTFNTAMASAMSTRASGLSSAWGQTETSARNTALKEVWKTWKSDSKNAHAEMKSARKSAWETLKTTAKSSCKVSLPKEESLGKESDGSITL
ncbi:hypothetical protein K2X96_03600 [Patescibacteria group bacterium]|nr:hypothetical protein [Patescibacteria group bacterium]